MSRYKEVSNLRFPLHWPIHNYPQWAFVPARKTYDFEVAHSQLPELFPDRGEKSLDSAWACGSATSTVQRWSCAQALSH